MHITQLCKHLQNTHLTRQPLEEWLAYFNASSNYDANAKLKDAETDDSFEWAAKLQKKQSKQTLSKHKVHYDSMVLQLASV